MGGRYGYGGGRLPDVYVPDASVPDFGRLEGQALSNALRTGQIDEMGRTIRGQSAFDEALKGNGELDALNKITAGGHGSFAMALKGGALDRLVKERDLETKAREASLHILGNVNSDEEAQTALDYIERTYPELGPAPPSWRKMPFQELKRQTALSQFKGPERVRYETQQHTAKALGLPEGVDPGTYIQGQSTQQQMKQREEEGPLRNAERDARLRKLQEEAEYLKSKAAQTHSNVQVKFDEYEPERSVVYAFNRQSGVPERWDPQTQSWQPFGVKSEKAPAGKPLDQATADWFFKAAGKDPRKATQMARDQGFDVPEGR